MEFTSPTAARLCARRRAALFFPNRMILHSIIIPRHPSARFPKDRLRISSRPRRVRAGAVFVLYCEWGRYGWCFRVCPGTTHRSHSHLSLPAQGEGGDIYRPVTAHVRGALRKSRSVPCSLSLPAGCLVFCRLWALTCGSRVRRG